MKFISIIIIVSLLISIVPEALAQESDQFERLSPQKAQNLSLFWTLGLFGSGSLLIATESDAAVGFGSIVAWSGLLIAPGFGHLYAHHSWRFWRGLIIRNLATGLIIVAMAISWDDPDVSGGWELFIGGSVLLVGSAVYDIVTSKKSAIEYNKQHEAEELSIAPAYFPETKALGLSLSFRF